MVTNLLRAAASLTVEFANWRRHWWINFLHLPREHVAQTLSGNQLNSWWRADCVVLGFWLVWAFFSPLFEGGVWRGEEEKLERKQQARLVWPRGLWCIDLCSRRWTGATTEHLSDDNSQQFAICAGGSPRAWANTSSYPGLVSRP